MITSWNTPLALLNAALLMTALLASPLLAQTTYVIDSLGDEPTQDNNSLCISTVGTCTLRTALQSSLWADPPVTIEVSANIPTSGSGKSVIEVTSPLPPILSQTTIAGDSHPDFEGNGFTNLVIAGVSGVDEASGLVVSGA
jgi:hypothetical protein